MYFGEKNAETFINVKPGGIYTYRGCQKNIYTFQEMLSTYYFSKLN